MAPTSTSPLPRNSCRGDGATEEYPYISTERSLLSDWKYKVMSGWKAPFSIGRGRGIDIFEVCTSNWRPFSLRPEMKITDDQIDEKVPESVPYLTALVLGGKEEITKIETYRARCFLGLELHSRSRTSKESSPYLAFEQCVGSLVIHVPALRDNPRAYPKVVSDFRLRLRFPGTFENYIASIIEFWQDTQNCRLEKLGRALKKLGLTWKVEARRLNDVEIELLASRLPNRQEGEREDLVNIADMGVGVSQVLPSARGTPDGNARAAGLSGAPGARSPPSRPSRVGKAAGRRGPSAACASSSRRTAPSCYSAYKRSSPKGNCPPDHVALHWFERGDAGATTVTSADTSMKPARSATGPRTMLTLIAQVPKPLPRRR